LQNQLLSSFDFTHARVSNLSHGKTLIYHMSKLMNGTSRREDYATYIEIRQVGDKYNKADTRDRTRATHQ